MNIKSIAGIVLLGAGALLLSFGEFGGGSPNTRKIEFVKIPSGGGINPGGTGETQDLPPSPENPNPGDPLIDENTPPSEYGDLLAQGAYDSIGFSTANIPGTENGELGCAAAVSVMFQNATGQQLVPGRDIVLGTGELYYSLSNDSRFVAVPVSQAQAGDIVVTARSSSRAGHTGIVGNNGEIISNSSSGFNGSAPGTVQNNYTIDSWQRTVTPRNPNQTMAFRYVGG